MAVSLLMWFDDMNEKFSFLLFKKKIVPLLFITLKT
jgi:hypothetical protein